MNVSATSPATAASAATTSSSSSGVNALGGADDTEGTFLNLLVTELKTQDPLSPMDPTEMVGQLVQFNTLNEIMGIRQTLKTLVTSAPTSAPTKA